jgi:hypothetical protein
MKYFTLLGNLARALPIKGDVKKYSEEEKLSMQSGI